MEYYNIPFWSKFNERKWNIIIKFIWILKIIYFSIFPVYLLCNLTRKIEILTI
ncbi:MAG: hypothetical protein Satyrvirus27_9 [Satyrvirus sp.]|uniref:Uncharacterized protein n=1 Tax=Satyrvirus sp. TaxID=2487771 RepID=A0A3G5AEM3_9VIRU|nr:MAG: hypothetical protein Satyrvirus27_9 [Satyrvirus sp.]